MDKFDELVGRFRALGLTEAGAKAAVMGHDYGTEAAARRGWNATATSMEAERAARESARLTSPLSDGERDLAQAATDALGLDAEAATRYARTVHQREAGIRGDQQAAAFCIEVAANLRKPRA